MQLSWVKRLYDNNFHPWKIIPTYLFSNLASNYVFYPNLSTQKLKGLHSLPIFYRNIVKFWCEVSSASPITSSGILSECIFNNALILIANKAIRCNFFGNNKVLHVIDLFDDEGTALPWEIFKNLHKLPHNVYFKWLQLIDSIPEKWRNIIKIDKGRSRIFCDLNPHLIVNAKNFPIKKLSSQEFYKIFINAKSRLPTSQIYIINLLSQVSLPWKQIYILPRIVTVDAYTRMFQYKCLNNILYLNNALFKMKLSDTPLCSFCNAKNETVSHLFYECNNTKLLWQQVVHFFRDNISLPPLSVQSAIVGFLDAAKDDFVLVNIILLSFKITLYKHRSKHVPILANIVNNISKREIIERSYSIDDPRKRQFHVTKWQSVNSLFH